MKTGYCRHIERLMVLGNLMLLCEFDPDIVYRWFIELFMNAYDCILMTNMYCMSKFADGSIMSMKPYISSSNYLMKLSNYNKGDWRETGNGLFWRFMEVNREFFEGNPRLRMLVGNLDKKGDDKLQAHLDCTAVYFKIDERI